MIVSGPGVSTDGFIRMVTKVQSDSQGLVLKTVPVPIQLAFRKLHVKFTRKIENIADLGIAPAPKVKIGKKVLGKGKWMELPIDFFAFNDDDPLTLDDQVHVTGKLSGGIEYFFGFDIDPENSIL